MSTIACNTVVKIKIYYQNPDQSEKNGRGDFVFVCAVDKLTRLAYLRFGICRSFSRASIPWCKRKTKI